MDCANSWSRPCSKTRRGCSGLGSMRSILISTARSACTGIVGGGTGGSTVAGRVGNSAPSPLPSALRVLSCLFMVDNLFRKLDIALRPFRSGIVRQYGFAETWCLSQAHTSRNNRLEDFVLKELLKICCHLPSQISPVIVHRQQYSC